MFRGNFPVSRCVVGGSGDTDRTGFTAPVATQLVAKRNRPGSLGCSVVSVKPVCLGIDRLEFFSGVESAGLRVADIVGGIGSSSQFFHVSSAALDDGNSRPMALAPDDKAGKKSALSVMGTPRRNPDAPMWCGLVPNGEPDCRVRVIKRKHL